MSATQPDILPDTNPQTSPMSRTFKLVIEATYAEHAGDARDLLRVDVVETDAPDNRIAPIIARALLNAHDGREKYMFVDGRGLEVKVTK